MLERLASLFGRKPALIKGAGKLQEGQARKVEFGDPVAGDGVEVILCRVEGKMYALDAVCPHEGGRIAEGVMEQGRYVTCPLHNYVFDPKTGKPQNAVCRKARTFKIRETDGDAEIWL